jgi:hypothetical protein
LLDQGHVVGFGLLSVVNYVVIDDLVEDSFEAELNLLLLLFRWTFILGKEEFFSS